LLPLVGLFMIFFLLSGLEEITRLPVELPGTLLLYLISFWFILQVARTRDYS
jgi:hypothetical protein